MWCVKTGQQGLVIAHVGRSADVAHLRAAATRHLVASVEFREVRFAPMTRADPRFCHLLLADVHREDTISLVTVTQRR